MLLLWLLIILILAYIVNSYKSYSYIDNIRYSTNSNINNSNNNNRKPSLLYAGFGNKISKNDNTKQKLKPKDESNNNNNNDNNSNNSNMKIKQKGDGSTVINHCPSFNLKYPGLRVVHHDPPVFEIDNFFDNNLCDDYINRATSSGLQINSQTFSNTAGSTRTSTTWYNKYSNVPEFLHKANKLTGRRIETYEEPQIVRYEYGQQFSWHYDAIPKSLQDSSGNRLITLLVYLNDVTIGGSTSFKDLGIQIKPIKGKALVFFPCLADGTPDDRTMHAGQVAGETKWICQMWMHENNYIVKAGPDGSNHADAILEIEKLHLK